MPFHVKSVLMIHQNDRASLTCIGSIFRLGWRFLRNGKSSKPIGIHARTGNMLWAKATKPWLYTKIQVIEDRLVYGTSGSDGFLVCVNPEDGQTMWELFLKNGCAYFGKHNNTVVTGSQSGQLLQIDVRTGKIIDRLQLPNTVLGGNITIQGNCVLTMGWHSDTETFSLLCVELEG